MLIWTWLHLRKGSSEYQQRMDIFTMRVKKAELLNSQPGLWKIGPSKLWMRRYWVEWYWIDALIYMDHHELPQQVVCWTCLVFVPLSWNLQLRVWGIEVAGRGWTAGASAFADYTPQVWMHFVGSKVWMHEKFDWPHSVTDSMWPFTSPMVRSWHSSRAGKAWHPAADPMATSGAGRVFVSLVRGRMGVHPHKQTWFFPGFSTLFLVLRFACLETWPGAIINRIIGNMSYTIYTW